MPIDSYFITVIIAGVIAGASTGLLGAFIIGLRMPFIGTCISHASMAGFIWGGLLSFNNPELWPITTSFGGIIASAISAVSLATIREDKTRLDKNVGLAIIFCFMLGITFLGIGLNQDSRADMLGLLWGNILFVNTTRTITIGVLAFLLILFVILFNKEMKVLLFSRSIAAATGVHETLVYSLFLTLSGIVLAVNMPLIGGLMIFSLITCPAAAAYQVCKGYVPVLITSACFGMLSTMVGFFVSYYLDLPTGACIVIVSVVIFALTTLFKHITGQHN